MNVRLGAVRGGYCTYPEDRRVKALAYAPVGLWMTGIYSRVNGGGNAVPGDADIRDRPEGRSESEEGGWVVRGAWCPRPQTIRDSVPGL